MPGIPFNNARGSASSLQMAPPFAFSDVTMSVFPLRASLPTLENFCRNYLNQAPNIVQFQPFVPFVYLVILDYGRMSLEAANMGWVSQREVAFGIPLRWLNAEDDGLHFHDWAFSSPFIFVDNELSMSTGREVYGWPKLLARLDPSVSEWVRDPHGARRVFQVSTKGANKAFAGETSRYRPLLSVYQHRTAGVLDVPPSLDAIVKPLSQMSNAASGLTRLGMDLTKTFLGMASDRITGSSIMPDLMDMNTLREQLTPERLADWRNTKDWMPGIKDALWSMFPRMYANTINFKQFRDAANPHGTCYQALTAARMPVKSLKQGGFLGPQNMLMGQLDGGFRIDIHHLAGLPIVESLGLEVSETREADGSVVSSLSPIAPLWMRVDMTYGLANTLMWRDRSGAWQEGETLTTLKTQDRIRRERDDETFGANADEHEPRIAPDMPTGADASDSPFEAPEELDDGQGFDYIRAMNFFNTARGASEAVGGSFSVPDASVRVLPLKADAETLQTFVRDYMRFKGKLRFEAWGDFVYLIISDFKQMNSEISAIAKRRARELTLAVPVKCYEWYENDEYPQNHGEKDTEKDAKTRRKRGKEKLVTTGFVNAFTFVDDVETAITANEVFGVPSMGSRIVASENEWLSRDYSQEQDQHEILSMNAQVLPELMIGAEAEERKLVDVCTHHPHHAAVQETEDEAVNRWVGVLADDLESKLEQDCAIASPLHEKLDYEEIEKDQNEQKEAICAAQGFALKILGGELPLNQFSLKQFRDSYETQDACYQGLVLRRHHIMKLSDFREIDAPLHVSITDYPTQPITEILGLKAKFSYPGRDRLVKVFEAVRPFSLNADLRRGAGVTLFERVGSKRWMRVDITEEMFGWRKVPRDGIADMVRSVKGDDRIEMAYLHTSPKTGRTTEKRLKNVKRSFLEDEWKKGRVDTGQASDVKVRQRYLKDVVSVVADPETLATLEPSKAIDIATWNHLIRDRETGFKQETMAEYVERYNPATVLDKVLSRGWGLAKGTRLPKFGRPDFCVPTTAVPERIAPKLFPEHERSGIYWPQTKKEFDSTLSSHETEATAFKFELNSAIQILALLYPAALSPDNKSPKAGSWSFDGVITTLTEGLYEFLDEDQKQKAQEATQEFISEIQNERDLDGIMRASEKIVVNFVEAHLPEAFRVTEESMRRSMFEQLSTGQEQSRLIPSTQWALLVEALLDVGEKLSTVLGSNSYDDEIADHLEAYIARAKQNMQDMQAIETEGEHGPVVSHELITEPHTEMRDRLRQVMTGAI